MGKKKTILIVDDDIDFSQMAKMMLEETGLYQVNVCNRSSQVLSRVREIRPDLLLLDIVMPEMDGTRIAGDLKEDRELCTIPVIFLTSLISPEEEAEKPSMARWQYIAKPITGQDLIKRIKEYFELEN